MARNLLILTIVGGINIQFTSYFGVASRYHRISPKKKKIGRDTAVVDHHSGKPGARLPIRGDSWEAKNGGCMAVDTRPGNLTVYRGFNGDLMGFYSDSMGY